MLKAIDWFARNGVAANLLMVSIAAAGLHAVLYRIPLEAFPEFDLNSITISVSYRGATPSEAEEGVVFRIEEEIQDLEGIEEIESEARENAGVVTVEIEKGYDPRHLLDDIKNRIDAINTFPEETEKPLIRINQRLREVIGVVVSADMDERELRRLGEQVRDDIVNLPGVTQVKLTAVRPYEISIEVPERNLRKWNLSLRDVAAAVQRSSLDLPAGSVKTQGGEVLISTKAQAYARADFAKVVVTGGADGRRVTLEEIAEIRDGFEETPLYAMHDGKPAVYVAVSRIGKQSTIEIAGKVKRYIEEKRPRMPPGVELSYWLDNSKSVYNRLDTLKRSAITGLILVALLLTLFLRFTVAFWVCVGIPICFLGALATMPFTGTTINLISLFAFILVLGIVVDDAIVIGENIYAHFRHGDDPQNAVINGAKEVAIPVIFGVITTMIAFMPLMMISGVRGTLFMQIPLIVIPVLFFSIIESKLILPSHLKHLQRREGRKPGPLARLQGKIADGLEAFVRRVYQPFLQTCLNWRYLTLAVFIAVLCTFFGLVKGGHVKRRYFPVIESETVTGSLTMALGTPSRDTEARVRQMYEAAENLQQKYIGKDGSSVIKGISSLVGATSAFRGGAGETHKGSVAFEITPLEEREKKQGIKVSARQLVQEWRGMIGPIPGAQDLNFRAQFGRGGDPIDVQLAGSDFEVLNGIADQLKAHLGGIDGVFDISDSFQFGKQEIQLEIKPEAELLGLSNADLGRQVRQAFFGFEAQRIQRGRDDLRVMVRLPRAERESLDTLKQLRIRTEGGTEVPFSSVADLHYGRGYPSIRRVNRNRVVNVRADADSEEVNVEAVLGDLGKYLDGLLDDYPGVYYSFEGRERERKESFDTMFKGSIFVLFAIYAMMAIPFRSYLQPLIVMSVIPFGVCGAILGHMIMNWTMSIMSAFGMLALVGVVVNDSLVLVDYVNRKRREGMELLEAVRIAGGARFRPILLTSLTTFFGLAPLIWEKSTQAKFLIPMAISLGFGILFATFITLILVPANYYILEDIKRFFAWVYGPAPETVPEAKPAD